MWFTSFSTLYGSTYIRRVFSLSLCFSCNICLCTTRPTPGALSCRRANLGHDPIQALLGTSNDSNNASWIKSKESHGPETVDWSLGLLVYLNWLLTKSDLTYIGFFAFQRKIGLNFRPNSGRQELEMLLLKGKKKIIIYTVGTCYHEYDLINFRVKEAQLMFYSKFAAEINSNY